MKLNKFVIGGLLILGAVVFLIANATKDASQYFMTVDELKAHNQRRIDDFTQRISDVEDVDMAEAITQYQTAQTVYTAALQVASTTHQLSLMDFIRG